MFGQRAARTEDAQVKLLREALPDMATGPIRALVKRRDVFQRGGSIRTGRGRAMTIEETAIEVLAFEEDMDPHTILDALRIPKLRDRIARKWAHGA